MTTSLIMYCKPFSACEQIGEQMKGSIASSETLDEHDTAFL